MVEYAIKVNQTLKKTVNTAKQYKLYVFTQPLLMSRTLHNLSTDNLKSAFTSRLVALKWLENSIYP